MYLYWANYGGRTIERAKLDGTAETAGFITVSGEPEGTAVDGNCIYWATTGLNVISRANLDGSAVDQNVITGARAPEEVAVFVPESGTGLIATMGILVLAGYGRRRVHVLVVAPRSCR